MELNIDKIYICHWNELDVRKDILTSAIKSLDITNEISWIETHNASELNIEELKKTYPNIDKNIFSDHRPFKKSELSLALKHIDIFKEVYEKKYKSVLILEDDVLFAEDFVNRFNLYFSQLPPNYDLCFIGTCCNIHYQAITPNVNVYKTDKGSRCTHAYLISYDGVCKIINDLNLLNDPIDFFLNNLVVNRQLNNYWFEPALAFQNNFRSTIQ